MKKISFALTVIAITCAVSAEPLRVGVLDFENLAGVSPDINLIGGVHPENIASKGVHVLGSVLANADNFRLVDRRDFIGRIESLAKEGPDTMPRPSFLRAAQALNMDVVLRGTLMSLSPSRQVVDQGGYKTEFIALSLRIALQAVDARDGTIIAATDSATTKQIRQTDSSHTVVGEDDIIKMLKEAMENAIPKLNNILQKRVAQARERPQVNLSVKTSADPALVELNGMLIGTTPIENFQVYQGDHMLTIGKAGYRDVNKRVLIKNNMSIEIPMLRTELDAEELKEVLESMRMNVILGVPEPALIIKEIN